MRRGGGNRTAQTTQVLPVLRFRALQAQQLRQAGLRLGLAAGDRRVQGQGLVFRLQQAAGEHLRRPAGLRPDCEQLLHAFRSVFSEFLAPEPAADRAYLSEIRQSAGDLDEIN